VNQLLFLVLAALTVLGALGVVLRTNPVHSALALVATLFLLSVLFVGLDAQLVAVLQIIVYAGAIVVLFLFVIMLLNLQTDVRVLGGGTLVAAALAGGLALAALLVAAVRGASPGPRGALPAGFGATVSLAHKLFTDYLLSFELTSILLLVAVVGAVALAQKKR
jgi:NADH-quinone oxidoreductase subunit J